MTRHLPLLVLLVAGCTPQPQPAPQPAGPDRYAQGVWSWSIAIEAGSPQPKPSPQPASGECDNCRGTGRLGDGTVSVPCPVCGGDGRLDNAELEAEPSESEDVKSIDTSPEPPVEPEPQSVEPMTTKAPQATATQQPQGQTIWRRIRRGVTGR